MTPATPPSSALPVDITVIVITFNRAPMLAQTLESLTRIDTRTDAGKTFRYEVLVVNNASTDNTQEVIDSFLAPDQWGSATCIRSVLETDPGVAPARNRGMSETTADWIAFHDDDQKAHTEWLAKLVDLTDRRSLKVVGGAVHLLLPENNDRMLAPQCRTLLGERVGWDQEMPYTRKRVPGTNNILIHRSIIEEVGGFDPRLKVGGTDADLYRRIRSAGYQAWYTPESIVYHMIPEKRLGNDYMRWTASRHGMHLALREFKEWGRVRLAGMIALRAAQAGLNYLPRFLAHTLLMQKEKALGARALLWRSQAYLTRAAELLVRGNEDESGQDVSLDFRQGREKLVQPTKPSQTVP